MLIGRGLAVAVLVLLATSRAWAAEPSKAECITANESAQDLRQAGKLRDARTKLALCMASSCPGPVREDCAQRLGEIDAVMPSIVFEVKDSTGNYLGAVRVSIDGQLFIERLDGTAVPVDPGQHRFVFESEGMARTEKILVIREGDKGRHERVVLGGVTVSPAPENVPPRTGEPSSPHRLAIPTLSYVAAGIGIVGLAVGIGTGIAAGDKNAALKGECTPYPNCPAQAQSDLNGFHSLRDWSTAAYVVGAAGIVGATALWLWLPQNRSDGPVARLWIGPGSAGIVGAF